MEAERWAETSHNISCGILYGVGAGALWGLIFLAPEFVPDFTPLQLAIGRYLAYGGIAAVMIAPRWKTVCFRLKRQDWHSLFWLSLFGNMLYYIMLSTAVQTGGIALTALVIGFLPVIITIIGSREKEAVRLFALLPSLMLCVAGALCIGWRAIEAPGATSQSGEGLLYAIAALASWTAYAVGNSRCLIRLNKVSAHDWNLLMGLMTGVQAILLIPVVFLCGHLHHEFEQWIRLGIVAAAVAITASIFGNALWNCMSRLLPLTMTGQMILFETLFALMYGFLWEKKWPCLLEIMAFTFIVFSVLTCISVHQKQASKLHGYTTNSSKN
ncbi:DMT family transporter [Acetobacter aceti]|nr:DMT family transporter [Acetobacter aceti]